MVQSCTGNTSIIMGTDLISTSDPIQVDSFSATTIFSGGTNLIDIINDGDTFITGFTYDDANTLTIGTSDGIRFDSNISIISGITTTGDILPDIDNTVDVGTTITRFRNVNTVNGKSTYWESDTISATTITASTIHLGLDSANNIRIITADSSVLNNDCLGGGTY